jgi:hypothetical protein
MNKIHVLLTAFVLTSLTAFSQTQLPEEKVLEEWLPSAFGDYKLDGVPLTVTSKAEEMPYSMASKNYKKGTATLTVVVFDYAKNKEMLKKYAASWSVTPAENDPQKANITTVEELPAWQAYDEKEKTAQLYVNVKDRYLLYLTGKENSLDFLKSVVKELKPRQLPK